MANLLDLRGRKTNPVVAPASLPLAAGPVAGVTGRLPLPVGHTIAEAIPDEYLTPEERRVRDQLGFAPGSPMPRDTARLLKEAREEALRSVAPEALQPPVALDTPPLKYTSVNIDSLPPETRARLTRDVQGALAAERAASNAQQVIQSPNAEPFRFEIPPELRRPSEVPQFATPEVMAALHAAQAPAPAVTPTPPPAPPAPVESMTGLAGGPANCPHCEWPLTQPDPGTPEPGERLAFLHAILGQKPYEQQISLLSGNLTAVFRTLTTAEIDLIQHQVYTEMVAGKIPTERDFHERLSRLRTFSQLQQLRSPQFDYLLGDGLSRETNPRASRLWQVDEGAVLLIEIEKFMLENVLTSESLFRIVHQACMRFNRVVAKLEAMVDNPDFLKTTGASS